jgi:transposase-like protein
VGFRVSERRDVAAKSFIRKAMKHHGTPRVITLDAYPIARFGIEGRRKDAKPSSRQFEQGSQKGWSKTIDA